MGYTSRRLMVALLSVVPVATAIGRQVPPGDPPPEPPPRAGDIGSLVPVEETIRLAIEAVDRLESLPNPRAEQELVDEIREYVQHIERADLGNVWLLYIVGRFNVLFGQLPNARDQLQKFVDTREGRNHWRAHEILGDLFVDHFPRHAKVYYQKANALKPDEPGVLKGLSACLYKLVEYPQAVEFARDAVQADGRANLEYIFHLARMLSAQGLYAEAQRESRSALALAWAEARSQPEAAGPLGEVDEQYKLLIEITQARAAAEPTVADHPADLARAMRQRTEVAALLAHHKRLQMLENAVGRVESPTPALIEEHAIALAEAGLRDRAIVRFEELLRLDPGNGTALEWLKRLGAPAPESAAPAGP